MTRPCQWPIGDPRDRDFHYCGVPSAGDRRAPYCAKHLARAYVTPPAEDMADAPPSPRHRRGAD